jgi:protein-S-isoprenylcysteine O-methyltransferase Ste14
MRVSSPRTASIIGFIMMVAAMILLLTQHQLIAQSLAGCAVQIAAALLMVWARVTFGRRSFHAAANPTEGELVTRGPYRFVRHPIYAAILLFVFATFADHLSAVTTTAFSIALAGVVLRILAEERLLRARYPEYANYAARTKRLLPFVY